jgi:hypothetical protein
VCWARKRSYVLHQCPQGTLRSRECNIDASVFGDAAGGGAKPRPALVHSFVISPKRCISYALSHCTCGVVLCVSSCSVGAQGVGALSDLKSPVEELHPLLPVRPS